MHSSLSACEVQSHPVTQYPAHSRVECCAILIDAEAPRDALVTRAHYVRQVKCTAAYRHANCKITQWLNIQPTEGWKAAKFIIDTEAPRDALVTRAHHVRQVECRTATSWLDRSKTIMWHACSKSVMRGILNCKTALRLVTVRPPRGLSAVRPPCGMLDVSPLSVAS